MDESLYHQFLAVERTHWWFNARREFIVRLVRDLVPGPGRVLDVGCGTGYFLEALPPDLEPWGVDMSETAVRMCRERGLVRVHPGTSDDLSRVSGERYDVITLLDVVEHLDDDLGALRNAKALLKPGGSLVVTVPAYRWMWSRHDDLCHHRRRYTRGEVEVLLRSAGLEPDYVTYFNCRLFPLAWAVRSWRKWTRDTTSEEMALPSPGVNSLLRRIFLGEGARLARRGQYPFGLSILAVGRNG